jgi:hypothetical protein
MPVSWRSLERRFMPLSSIRHITVTAALAAGLVTAAFAQDVTGAGATFPAPISWPAPRP